VLALLHRLLPVLKRAASGRLAKGTSLEAVVMWHMEEVPPQVMHLQGPQAQALESQKVSHFRVVQLWQHRLPAPGHQAKFKVAEPPQPEMSASEQQTEAKIMRPRHRHQLLLQRHLHREHLQGRKSMSVRIGHDAAFKELLLRQEAMYFVATVEPVALSG